MMKCMEYEEKGSRPRGRPKTTWREVVEKGYQARKLDREDAMDIVDLCVHIYVLATVEAFSCCRLMVIAAVTCCLAV